MLTNLLINAFWNSKLFPKIEKPNEQLIVESIGRPRL